MKYSQDEAANIITHLFGTACAIVFLPVLMWYSVESGLYLPCAVYSITMLMMFISSVIYHCIKEDSELLWRKIDHACIFLFIAGSYTPFIAKYFDLPFAIGSLCVVWTVALFGAGRKLFASEVQGHGIGSLASYLILGWYFFLTYPITSKFVPIDCILWLIAGGLWFTVGVIFFRNDTKYKFFHAIWHVFVILGVATHYITLMKFVV